MTAPDTRSALRPADLTLWTPVCRFDLLVPGRGVCALVGQQAVAIFRVAPGRARLAEGTPGRARLEEGTQGRARPEEGEHDRVYAIGNHDPYCDASVLSRGLVGSVEVDGADVPYVASPMRKQRFDLRSGRSLEDPGVSVGSWPVRVADGVVEVTAPGSSWRNDLETVA